LFVSIAPHSLSWEKAVIGGFFRQLNQLHQCAFNAQIYFDHLPHHMLSLDGAFVFLEGTG
jgi:hypothetical protein